MDWFSRALAYEYKDKGIIIQSLVPSYIATSLVRFSSFLQRPSFVVPDPERFVKSAIQTIGISNRTTGFWSHGLQVESFIKIYFLFIIIYYLKVPLYLVLRKILILNQLWTILKCIK